MSLVYLLAGGVSITTIKDVAEAAGVSIGIVSKAFNNYPDISAKTRERVLKIAKEMNYTPNVVAKNLSSKKKKTIGLIASGILDSEEKDNSNLFKILKGVYATAEETHYEFAVYFIDQSKQKQRSYTKFCQERNIGGVVLTGIRLDDPYFTELLEANIPCVLVDVDTEENLPNIGSVSTDNTAASYEMMSYLLENNHRNIIIMAGLKNAYVNAKRLAGVQKALEDKGLELEEDQVFYADFSEEKSYKHMKKILENSSAIPTAVFCFSDLMAYGVIRAIEEAGLKIPDDISVTGFDGLVINEYLTPPLTTVKQNFFEMGKQATLLLQDILKNKPENKKLLIDYEIINRESVKKLR